MIDNSWAIELVNFGFWFVIFYYTFANTIYLFLLGLALWTIKKERKYRPLLKSFIRRRKELLCPGISVIMPAYNEEANIVSAVNSILKQDYPSFEVIIVNDGSKDDTVAVLKDAFDLESRPLTFTGGLSSTTIKDTFKSRKVPNLIVIDKLNGGKSDALNCGISFSRRELVCCLDADSLLDDNALLSVAVPFIEEPDRVVAAGGTIRVVNGSEIEGFRVTAPKVSGRPIVVLQIIEYIRSFMCGRVGWNSLNSTMVISGAFGLFSRSAMIEIGGYDIKTVGEDMEVVMELHKHFKRKKEDYKIVFIPDPVCWTEVPESLKTLRRQRSRWQRGLFQSLYLYKDFFFSPKMGAVGMIGYPYFFFIELLSPVFEVFSYLIIALAWWLGVLNMELALLFFFIGILYGALMTVMALLIEESYFSRYLRVRDFLKLMLASFIEAFGYRQLLNIFRLYAFLEEAFGVKAWGEQQRKGFKK